VVRNRMPGGVRGNGGNPVTYSIYMALIESCL
jgi:hypothetical protein